ncbi:MAG TPA: LysR family transcriptional regulator [Accumulibacter sp.]|nr:LysR family transcriptional regulator [Accumulibacter sp.]
MNRFDDLQVFVSAAEAGSFSVAARRLGISPVVASAVIKRLEAGIGQRLFERSTRRVRLSEAGERLLPHARDVVRAIAAGEAAIGDESANGLSGPIRLSMPSDLARNCLIGWIEDFLVNYPANEGDLLLDLRVTDRPAEMLEQPVDFALRYGTPEDSGMVALPVAPANTRVLCAAPSYLARYGEPESLGDLRKHNCLRFVRGDFPYSRWRFGRNGEQMIEVSGDRVADDGGAVRQWAVAGLGIAYKSQLDIADDLISGRLQKLLPELPGESAPLTLLVVSRSRITPPIRRLAGYLASCCSARLAGV